MTRCVSFNSSGRFETIVFNGHHQCVDKIVVVVVVVVVVVFVVVVVVKLKQSS